MNQKKLFTIITIIIVFFVLIWTFILKRFAPELFENYSNWQTIQLDECGTFMVPNDWKKMEKEGFIAFKNTSNNVLMVQVGKRIGYYFDDAIYDTNKDYDIKVLEPIYSEVFSNSAAYGTNKYEANGSVIRLFSVSFDNMNSGASFVFIDQSVSEEIIRKIAISFEPIIE